MFGNFAEAIKIVEKELKESKYISEKLALSRTLNALEAALEKYEDDYEHWCENQGIDMENMI